MDQERCIVAVVGGGLAGLSAAQVLSSHKEFGRGNVVLLDAAPKLGGRIQNVTGLAPWPVEIGPEFLHGTQNSSIKKLVDEIGCVQRELHFPDYYYIGHEGRLLSGEEAHGHPDIEQVHELFKSVIDEEPSVPDMSMAEYLRKKGVSQRAMGFAESIYGNDFGCSLDKLGVHECIEEARQWIYGDTYIILDRPLSSVVDYLAQDLNIRTRWAVRRIEQSEDGRMQLYSQDGRILTADFVILCVPVTILQQGLISFHPPLPERKIQAAKAIGMSNAMKVVMAFSRRFWPEGLFDVVCSDCFLPEVWMTEYPEVPNSVGKGRGHLGEYIVVGFIAGDAASRLAQLPEVEIFRQSLAQLDKMFGKSERAEEIATKRNSTCAPGALSLSGGQSESQTRADSVCLEGPTVTSIGSKLSGNLFLKEDVFRSYSLNLQLQSHQVRPASHSFKGGMVVNWADRSFIRGGYSHPSVNAQGARVELAEPVRNIFFAGEATHPGVNPCLQAAIDTGRRAANQVIVTCGIRRFL